ncbi:MAG: hypothetical protein ABFD45_11345 [Smithella sp.]
MDSALRVKWRKRFEGNLQFPRKKPQMKHALFKEQMVIYFTLPVFHMPQKKKIIKIFFKGPNIH